jgi:hypothetical protein
VPTWNQITQPTFGSSTLFRNTLGHLMTSHVVITQKLSFEWHPLSETETYLISNSDRCATLFELLQFSHILHFTYIQRFEGSCLLLQVVLNKKAAAYETLHVGEVKNIKTVERATCPVVHCQETLYFTSLTVVHGNRHWQYFVYCTPSYLFYTTHFSERFVFPSSSRRIILILRVTLACGLTR